MASREKSRQELLAEIEELRGRLQQAEFAGCRYRALLRGISLAMFRMTPDLKVVRQVESTSGLHLPPPFDFDPWVERYVHADDRDAVRQAVRTAVQDGTPVELDCRICHHDGRWGWISSQAVPLRSAAGEIVEWFGVVLDIEEHRWISEALRRQNVVLDGIGRILRAALTSHSEREVGKICVAVAEKVTQSEFGFLVELGTDNLLHAIEISDPAWESPLGVRTKLSRTFPVRGLFQRVILEGKPLYTNDPATHPERIGLPEGHPPLTSFLGIPLVHHDAVIGIIGLGNRKDGYSGDDIESMTPLATATVQALARIRSEKSLFESQQRLSMALEGGKMGMWEWDISKDRLIWSPMQYELLGLPLEDARPPVDLFFHHVHHDDVDGLKQSMLEAIAGRRSWRHEFRIIRPDGEVRWLAGAADPCFAADGSPEKMVGINYDVTDRRLAQERLEERVKERTVELTALNRELESFCYSVTHELGAPLRSMNCFSNILLQDYCDSVDAEGRSYLQKIAASASRMGALIEDLLMLSRVTRRKLSRKSVDLSSVAEEIVSNLQRLEPYRSVQVEIGEGIRGRWDPALAKLILENLIGNAWKYTGKVESPRIQFGVTLQKGERVFFVRDNGIGFDMAYADKIFLPFERLHRMGEYEGTGIGLATVQRVVAMHGGRAWAEAEEGKGATFFFTEGIR